MHQKNILLIHPACNTKTFASNKSEGAHQEKTISPPLGVLYLAAELIEAGYTVEACDYNAEQYSDENLFKYIAKADIVGISMMSFNRDHSYRIIKTIHALRPELPIIAGGPDCILHPRVIPQAKLTVYHEAEKIIVPVVEAVLNDKDLSNIPGIMYADSRKCVRYGKEYQCNDDLDCIKFPRRELLRDNKGYSVIGKKGSRKITTLITSRGCPKRCAFCAHKAVAYRKYRARSVHNVIKEIIQIAEQGYEVVGIADDNFTADKKRAMEIMQNIHELKTGLRFVVQGRADAANFELYSLMKKADVAGITFGLESGNQETLDFYNKETTVEQNRNAVYIADKVGMYTGGLFILGAPMETKEHFEKTYRFATSIPLDITSFWVLDYTYGSTLWDRAFAEGKIGQDEYNVPAGKERGTSTYYTEEIEKIARDYFFRYFSRPSYWLRQIGKLIRTREIYFLRILAIGLFWLVMKRVNLAVNRISSR